MTADVRSALKAATAGLVEREALVELIVLAAVAREHLLVIGPPGTAKSEAVRRVASAFGGHTFEYLLGRFTEPSEIFGPVDLQRLRDGVVETRTEGMLPEADLAFLDEVFLGSTAILNTLLGVLNDRVFRRGTTLVRCPLRVCVGASNSLPDDPALAAFGDRFLLRVFVGPLADPRLEELLEGGWAAERPTVEPLPLARLDELATAAVGMDLSGVRDDLAAAVRTLRGGGIQLSDRRIVKLQRLVAAAAALAGRDAPSRADLWPIVHAVPSPEGQSLARDLLRDLLAEAENPALPAAAEEASQGPFARAARLAEAAEELLGDPSTEGWRLKLEGVAREIDAAFDPSALPPALIELRPRVVAALAEAP
jgi:MoxR-like ATPase